MNSPLLQALRLEPAPYTPIWFMRQAGRSLPEYRTIREQFSLIEICRHPEICAEVTLQPVRRLEVDGAVMFGDIMLPLLGIGLKLEIVEGVGPVIERPIRSRDDLAPLRAIAPEEDVPYVLETIQILKSELGRDVPLIGFAGAPFTLASYLVEGKPSRDFARTKRLMYSSPDIWQDLMGRLAGIVSEYLVAQASAGVQALQLFDSWAGALSLDDYCRYVQPHTRAVLETAATTGLPVIHFGVGTGALLEPMRDAGGSTLGVDWRVPLDRAWDRIGHDRGIQGNLDPIALLGPWEVVEREATAILDRAPGRRGHIFNLGHGVHPSTSPDQLQRLVHYVHERSAQSDR